MFFWKKKVDICTEERNEGQTSFLSYICLKHMILWFHGVLLYFSIDKNYSVTAFDKHSWELQH